MALDGKLGGKSLCLIAIDLYGKARVAEEWSSDSALRARVRWRVDKSMALMNGCYRDFITEP